MSERLDWLKNVVANPPSDQCVNWPFKVNVDGYGSVSFEGRSQPASRVALVLFTGENPPDKQAAHAPIICHNPTCCNPLHMRWATRAENTADKKIDAVTPKRSQQLPKKHVDSQREEIGSRIRALAQEQGIICAEMARQCGVTRRMAGLWVKGKSIPQSPRLELLASLLKTDEQYLLYGDMPLANITSEHARLCAMDLHEEIEIDGKAPFVVRRVIGGWLYTPSDSLQAPAFVPDRSTA